MEEVWRIVEIGKRSAEAAAGTQKRAVAEAAEAVVRNKVGIVEGWIEVVGMKVAFVGEVGPNHRTAVARDTGL
jgi:hypothetical protein